MIRTQQQRTCSSPGWSINQAIPFQETSAFYSSPHTPALSLRFTRLSFPSSASKPPPSTRSSSFQSGIELSARAFSLSLSLNCATLRKLSPPTRIMEGGIFICLFCFQFSSVPHLLCTGSEPNRVPVPPQCVQVSVGLASTKFSWQSCKNTEKATARFHSQRIRKAHNHSLVKATSNWNTAKLCA